MIKASDIIKNPEKLKAIDLSKNESKASKKRFAEARKNIKQNIEQFKVNWSELNKIYFKDG